VSHNLAELAVNQFGAAPRNVCQLSTPRPAANRAGAPRLLEVHLDLVIGGSRGLFANEHLAQNISHSALHRNCVEMRFQAFCHVFWKCILTLWFEVLFANEDMGQNVSPLPHQGACVRKRFHNFPSDFLVVSTLTNTCANPAALSSSHGLTEHALSNVIRIKLG
jgi:hypothetical protein